MSAALLENFDLLATSLGGVPKLRELILSLAVRGRLVPQDPNDEPASALLKRIRAEKDRLIKEGKIKRDKPLAEIADHENPYELPASWQWVRLGDVITTMGSGWSPACPEGPTQSEEQWGVLKTTAVQVMEYREYEHKKLPETLKARSEIEVQPGDILITRAGPKSRVGISCVARTTRSRLMISDKIVRFHLASPLLQPEFVVLCMNAGASKEKLEEAKTGMAESQVNISQSDLRKIPLPICAVEEQSRIVAKVAELMALCDRLEAEQGHAARVQGHWVEAALDQLAESADADEFRRHWQHLAAHFDTLFTTPESIDRLDATLLRLAVRGKLVPQDPNDKPASELLTQIRAEKGRLIKDGRIKRDKPRPPVSDNEEPYELPEGWVWVTIPELCQIGGGSTPSKNIGRYWDGSIPWVSPKDMKVALIADAIDHVSPAALEETRLPLVPPNSILVVVRGMILAHSFPVGVTQTEVTINQDMKSLTPYAESLSSYLALAMRGFKSDILALVDRSTHGTCKLESERLFSYRFALPPIAEQSRIVAQVEKLQSLTASLKARLTAAQTKQAHLAEALIAEVTTPIGAALREGENSGPQQPFDLAAFKARMKAEHD